MADLFIVSEAEIGNDTQSGEPVVDVAALDAPKCVRCWKFDPHVGEDHDHAGLCPRCASVIRSMK